MNAYESVNELVNEARRIEQARRHNAKNMASLLRGNLRHCSSSDLAALKRELRDYNIHTGEWKP